MKKITRMTALLLAAAICLTSCSSPQQPAPVQTEQSTTRSEDKIYGITTPEIYWEADPQLYVATSEADSTSMTTTEGTTTAYVGAITAATTERIISTETASNTERISETAPEAGNGEETDIYIKSAVTSVTDQSYKLYGREGLYTGDWKGDRPEGTGTLKFSNQDFYKGEWKNGKLDGQCYLDVIENNATHWIYEGVYTDNTPSGYGRMAMHDLDSEYYTLLSGNFLTGQNMGYTIFDQDLRAVDLGLYINDQMLSFIDNPEADKWRVRYAEPSIWRYNVPDHMKTYSMKRYYGWYYGPIDSNGLPNGYGYFVGEDEYKGRINEKGKPYLPEYGYSEDESGYICNRNSYIKYIGNWEHGKRVGVYTLEYHNYNDPDFLIIEKGELNEKGELCGEYERTGRNHSSSDYSEAGAITKYNSTPGNDITLPENIVYSFIHHVNYDTFNYNLEECTDGKYRGSIETTEYYYDDGQYAYFERNLCLDPTEDEPLYEGKWYICDKSANITNYGIASGLDRTLWFTHKYIEYNNSKDLKNKLENLLAAGAFVTAIGIGVYAFTRPDDFKNSSAYQYVLKNRELCEQSTQAYFNRVKKKKELEEEAKFRASIGDDYSAKKALDEANSIDTNPFNSSLD